MLQTPTEMYKRTNTERAIFIRKKLEKFRHTSHVELRHPDRLLFLCCGLAHRPECAKVGRAALTLAEPNNVQLHLGLVPETPARSGHQPMIRKAQVSPLGPLSSCLSLPILEGCPTPRNTAASGPFGHFAYFIHGEESEEHCLGKRNVKGCCFLH